MNWMSALITFVRAFLSPRLGLAAENLALRQQVLVPQRSVPRPKLQDRDRRFWVWLSRLWPGWRSVLVIVSPATVIRWHRQGFRYYWRLKSRGKPGRPLIDAEARLLIHRLSKENSLWGAPRIQAELRLLGHDLAESTVAKYMARPSKLPSQSWKTFLKNHVGSLASVDFFVVPTATFRLLYCFVVLRHDRRRVVHFNVTEHPTAAWVARQATHAFPFDEAPKYLIRDRDGIYGEVFRQRVASMGIKEVLIAPRSPWQNPFVERLIGSIRRDCLDHLIVLNETHLRRILAAYFSYYNHARCHMALEGNSPVPREVEPPMRGSVIAEPMIGGLHHRYRRCG